MFYKKDGGARWRYKVGNTGTLDDWETVSITDEEWLAMTKEEKRAKIQEMYDYETPKAGQTLFDKNDNTTTNKKSSGIPDYAK